MKLELIVICGLSLLVIVNSMAIKCSKCQKNECECVQHILKAATIPPFPFCKLQTCEESHPLEFHPIRDVCSSLDLATVRPNRAPRDEVPKFANANSCECGYKDSPQLPKKYFADPVSQHLAAVAARKKAVSISEADLHFLGNAIKISPEAKPSSRIMEERLHKYNRHVIELKPARKNRIHYPVSSEEEEIPCTPEQQSYSDICFDKVNDPNPLFEQIKPYDAPCEICQERYSHDELYGTHEHDTEEDGDEDDYDEDNYEDEEDEEPISGTVTPETTTQKSGNPINKRSINNSWLNRMES
ncbi:uncharacterized protein LOC131427316 [Malaya genurostris]|uniref:uncharacterized protein LOC131427316 n=1 Tax=Malaya genurostris TaxID=325434 RepID=UPI0026F38C1E|nr:uncharacterized protein LOC131427316 [Malaya genurostris]